MLGTPLSGTWGRLARGVVALAGAAVLAGCATGYAYVQPDVAGSGGYYTSNPAYTGQGYYDWYGTGPYYPGTSGWGYYNGTNPYAGVFGWYGGGYYAYGAPFFFNLGISNVWDFPGYWGPWYSFNFPIWGCWDGCRPYHHRHGHWRHDRWHDHGHHDPRNSLVMHRSPPPGIRPERALIPLRWHRGSVRPPADFARRQPLESAAFAPHDFARAPIRREIVIPRFSGGRDGPAYAPSMTAGSAFGRRPFMPRPGPTARLRAMPMPQPVFQPAPAPRVAPRTSRTPTVKIP